MLEFSYTAGGIRLFLKRVFYSYTLVWKSVYIAVLNLNPITNMYHSPCLMYEKDPDLYSELLPD